MTKAQIDRHAAKMRQYNRGKVQGRIGIHWATVLLARDHRQQQAAHWVCDCPACEKVREVLK